MWQGNVIAIGIAKNGSGPVTAVDEVRAVSGRGLEGDRYYENQGTFTQSPERTGRQVTLIESEAIRALERDYKLTIAPIDVRRNIVTKDVPLNHLIDREFRVGEVRMKGVRLSEPCLHMATMIDKDNKDVIRTALMHRGGLRADILNDGTIRVGDVVEYC